MPSPRAAQNVIRARRISPGLLAVWLLCIAAFPGATIAAQTGAKKAFDIPAGEAAHALKQFSAQSGSQVIFPENALEGARTKALKGAFTPTEAIDRLLSGTNLRAAHDRESGSFAVSRVPDPPKETRRPNG
jgi:iron complex outermembrane recepter protein